MRGRQVLLDVFHEKNKNLRKENKEKFVNVKQMRIGHVFQFVLGLIIESIN